MGFWSWLFRKQVPSTSKKPTTVQENILERTSHFQSPRFASARESFDYGNADYVFWDKARRGQIRGLETSGLFLKPIASKKAAWVLSELPIFETGNAYTDKILNEWFANQHATILRAYEESIALGDCYVALNGDETLSVIPPHIIAPILDERDYAKIVGWWVDVLYNNPVSIGQSQEVHEEFRVGIRTRTVTMAGKVMKREVFKNAMNRIPLVGIHNNVTSNEVFGHPEGEPLLHVLHDYGEVLDAAITGNIKQGRPTPVFTKMGSAENVTAFFNRFGRTTTEEHVDGTSETFLQLDFTSDDALVLGETGEFKYESPGSFTSDTVNILTALFYMIVEHSELPEFIFGNAIQGSRASAEAQFPPLVKWIQKEQRRAESWLLELAATYLEFVSLYNVRAISNDIRVVWKPITAPNPMLTVDQQRPDKAVSQKPLTPEDAQAINTPPKTEIAKKRAIDRNVPRTMAVNAKRALGWRKTHQRGGTEGALKIATRIVRAYQSGTPLAIEEWRKIASYFPRHEAEKRAHGFYSGEDGYPSNGRIAWDLWGGDAGRSHARYVLNAVEKDARVSAHAL